MKRSILLTLATIATASSSSAAINNERRISSDFIESIDRANDKNHAVMNTEEEGGRSRRKLGWWGVALFFAEHGPCHGPLQPPHCHRHHGGGGGGGGSGGGGSGGGGSGSGYSDDAYGSSSSTDDASSSWQSDGHSSSTGTTSARNEQHNSSGLLNPASISFWMMIAAAAAVALAIAAMIVGSRRKEKENYHPLRGAVEKRMRLFGGFTDSCFGRERELCGADREVEMENSVEEGGYRSM